MAGWADRPKHKIKLEAGLKYRVVFRDDQGKKEMLAYFVGAEPRERRLLFSLRTEGGDVWLTESEILEAYEMPHTTKPRTPRLVVENVREAIEKARQAQQEHEQTHDVQLEIKE